MLSRRGDLPISRSVLVAAILFLGLAAFAFPSMLHLALSGSTPAQGERLTTAPTEIRLEFTEPVEVGVSSVRLLDQAGAEVALGALVREGDGDVLLVPIEGAPEAGEHTVVWQAVGRDGHPVRGEFSFVIETGAAGGSTVEEAAVTADSADALSGFGGAPAQSASTLTSDPAPGSAFPFYTGVRWLMYMGILGVIGSLGLALVVGRVGAAIGTEAGGTALVRGAGFGLAGALAVALSLPLRLFAQTRVVFGAEAGLAQAGALLNTLWGTAWVVQAIGCTVAAVGLLAARRRRRWGWGVAGLAAVMLAVSPGLSGHAVAVPDLTTLAVVADSLHVAAAGLWIGTLAAVLFAGLPTMHGMDGDRGGAGLAALVRGFSPLAMIAASVLIGTGLIATSFQLAEPSDLWTTSYGRVLSAKILVVFLVLAMGAYNWRRLGPRMEASGAEANLRRSGGIEVAVAMVAVLLTATLVALEPPAHQAPGEESVATVHEALP